MISVIMPVLNEAAIITAAIEAVRRQPGEHEVIVVDGGSGDGTREAIVRSEAHLVRYPGGATPDIGSQINLGAENAHGDVFVFMHCDVKLPPNTIEKIDRAMADPRVIGGGFVPLFSGPVPPGQRIMLKWVERVWQARTRRFCWYAGDTAPFIRADVFRNCGGYPTTGFASDWDFAATLRRLGPLATITDPVQVDSRRHVYNGVFKTLCVTGSIELMYRLGVKRSFLRNWYRKWLPRERQSHANTGSPNLVPGVNDVSEEKG
jgi:glycosyltransferase involved in cell wall biosynthesis